MPFQNPGITGDNLMCGSPPPAQPHRGHCSRWLVVNMLRRAPLRGALPPSPIPSPPASAATATQGQNLSNGQEKNSAEGASPVFCLPRTGVRGRDLWTFLLCQPNKTKAAKYSACPVLTAQGNKPPKRGLGNVSLALFWPLVASACPHTPAQPCCGCWSFYPRMHSS